MNCKQCQQEITDSLARGAGMLAPDVAAHQHSCAQCHEFHGAQRTLFASLETELRCIVNQPVPPSLLPGVRARLEQIPALPQSWIRGWNVALVAAAAIVSFNLAHTYRRAATTTTPSRVAASVPQTESHGLAIPVQQAVPPAIGTTRLKHGVSSAARFQMPQVIVLDQERKAFGEFVAEIPEQKAIAIALTRPAPPQPDKPLEIASLRIDDLQVKPLDSTENQEQPKSTR
jgi:hypothetical protein